MSTEVAVTTAADMVAHTPMEMIAQAVAGGHMDVEVLERLMALQERWDARQAEKALHEALAAFQAECPAIRKVRDSGGGNASGASARYSYSYAGLDDIERTIRPILSRHGLSYTHDVEIEGGVMVMVCTIHHVDGASRASRWQGPAADGGSMNAIQKVGSATTYARRYSLINALGLTTTDSDDDGGMGGQPSGPIDNDQLAKLQAEIKRVGADTKAFCQYLKVDALASLPASRYGAAMEALKRKERKG